MPDIVSFGGAGGAIAATGAFALASGGGSGATETVGQPGGAITLEAFASAATGGGGVGGPGGTIDSPSNPSNRVNSGGGGAAGSGNVLGAGGPDILGKRRSALYFGPNSGGVQVSIGFGLSAIGCGGSVGIDNGAAGPGGGGAGNRSLSSIQPVGTGGILGGGGASVTDDLNVIVCRAGDGGLGAGGGGLARANTRVNNLSTSGAGGNGFVIAVYS